MAKALMISSSSDIALNNAEEINLFGYLSATATEVNTQASATEGCSFTGLGFRITAGGSGTNTITFRDAGANGQQTTNRIGVGAAEDTTNTDTLTAGDLFNIAYVDTGTGSSCSWEKMNVEFASGHGNFHGAASYNGLVYDAASTTRFISLAGDLVEDGIGTEANIAFKVRAYDTFEALQVRVTANARTNNSIFRNRINGANGTGVITFATLVTGLLTATGLADAITDGQTVDASITLDTGVQDLTVSFVTGTFKSSANKSETWAARGSGSSRAASATPNYNALGGRLLNAGTEANNRIKPGFAGVASNLRCYLSANTYTGDGTLKLMQNGVAVLTTTITASGGAGWYENTADSVSFDDNDEFSFEFDEGTSGSITIWMVGVTFAPEAAGGGATQVRFGSILDGIGSQNTLLGNRLQ